MTTKHNIHLSDTNIGAAVREILEDRLADVVMHYQDVMVDPKKASKVTITVTLSPDERRRHFEVSIAGTTGLSPRKTAELDFYAGLNDNEQVEIKEYDPGQLRMFAADAD